MVALMHLLDRVEKFRGIAYLAIVSSVVALPFLVVMKFRPDLVLELDGFKLIILVLSIGLPPFFVAAISFMASDVIESLERVDLDKLAPAWLLGGAVVCHVLHPLAFLIGGGSLTNYLSWLALLSAVGLALLLFLGLALRLVRRTKVSSRKNAQDIGSIPGDAGVKS